MAHPAAGREPDGTVVTFYSYKGGTGRTMAMANVAWLLAGSGLQVLAVDWDLESPGLHRYFHPFLLDPDLRASSGVIEMIRDFAAATLEPGQDADWLDGYADVLRHATSVRWPFPGRGGIDLLPAGRQDRSYARRVSTFDWPAFYERLGGGAFIDALGHSMRRNYDYVLIDSRTGLSDSAGICTVQLPDTVVNCFTLSTQSVDGAVAVAKSIRGQRDGRPLRILPVPMRVEDAEQLKLDAGRDYARQEFASFLAGSGPEETDRYWGDVEIPYKPFYAYEEILASFGERPRLEGSLLAAFERLVRVLTDGRVHESPVIDEQQRRRWLLAFERRRPAVTSDVVISHAGVDRMWAEWIGTQLREAGLRVLLRDVEFTGGADPANDLSGTRHAVVLLSYDYVGSPAAATFWRRAERHDGGAPSSSLVPVRLDSTRLSSPFTDRLPVDLAGSTPEQAREALLAALDLPLSPPRPAGPAGPRFPATLPAVWRVPQRNTTFTGRRAPLDELRDRLSAGVTVVAPQALYGLGGVGKTQIALEYAYRFAANYDVVWWIPAEQPHLIRSSLADLGAELGLPMGGKLDDAVRNVLQALRRGHPYRRWLLIFDNADRPDAVRDFIPQGPGHVLLTSRNQVWSREARGLEIGVFSRPESTTLLTRRVPGLGAEEAALVAERLGDLPLAVEQAAAWLAATGMPVAAYLDLLDTQLLRMLDEHPPVGYPTTAAATWLMSLERLREDTPAAARLLEVCAFFAPEIIPTWLLYSSRFTEVLLPYDQTLRDPILQGRLVGEIGQYALATIADGGASIQIHRLVQAVIQHDLSQQQREDNRRQVQEILAAADPKDPDDAGTWPTYAQLLPHLRHCGALHSADLAVRQLVVDMVRYLLQRGGLAGSRELAQEALAIWQKAFGEDATTLFLGFHLGNAVKAQADYAEAYRIDKHCLDRLTALLTEDHPYTIMTATGVGADLRGLGRYAEARALDESTLARATRVFREDGHRTLLAANNLAVSLRLVGDFAGAARLDEQSLSSRRRNFGDRHLYTLLAANNYAYDLRALGEYRESLKLLEKTLRTYRELVGDDHPGTLRTASNLAVTLRRAGELQAAHALTLDTLRRYGQLHGPQHADTLSCLMNRACEEAETGDATAAVRTAQEVIDGLRRTQPEDHPLVLAGRNNLGIFTRLAGHPERARDIAADVSARFAATLGPGHPFTPSSQVNLADAEFDMGEHAAARRTDEAAYDGLTALFGPDSPETMAAAGNLAVSLRTEGRVDDADELHRQTLERALRVLGEDHPHIASLRTGTRLPCDIPLPQI